METQQPVNGWALFIKLAVIIGVFYLLVKETNNLHEKRRKGCVISNKIVIYDNEAFYSYSLDGIQKGTFQDKDIYNIGDTLK